MSMSNENHEARPGETNSEKVTGWHTRADQPSWWQKVLLWLSLPPLLLLLAVVALGPRFEQSLHQAPGVTVPVRTGSSLGATKMASREPSPTSMPIPTIPALVLATAAPTAQPVSPATAVPVAPAPTETAVPRGGSVTLTIVCTSSTPGFCEFLQGATITQNGLHCTLALGVYALVGQDTEPVSCTLATVSGTFVGAGVPCYTDNKGACTGKVTSQA